MKKKKFHHYLLICILLLSVTISAQTKTKVACIGNSITEGWGLPIPQKQSYPAVLQSLLQDNGFEVRNYGVSAHAVLHNSDIPYWNTSQYRDALAWSPDIVIIKLGTNDAKPNNWDVHKNEFKGDYLEFINSFKALRSHPKIYICYPLPIFSELSSHADPAVISDEMIPLISAIASETNSAIIDLYTPFFGKSDYFDDGLHPDVAGAYYLANLVAHAIHPAFEIDDAFFNPTTTPIEIRTEADLKALAYRNSTHQYILVNDITVTEKWSAANLIHHFKGNIDGDGHVIYGLNINEKSTGVLGFIRHSSGVIKNLGIENAFICGNENVGGFVGKLLGGTIENCYIANSYVEGRDHVGSLVGQLEGNNNGGGLIQNSYSAATVYSRDFQGGGLIGTSTGKAGKVRNCYFSGILGVRESNRAGGILALQDSDELLSIENCVNLAAEVNCGSRYRIASVRAAHSSLTNNYALDNLTSTDGSSAENGNDVSVATAKTKNFYQTSLNWNFNEIWDIDETNSYPLLKWQKNRTAQGNTFVLSLQQIVPLTNDKTLNLNKFVSSHGLQLNFISDNPEHITIISNQATAHDIQEHSTATITVSTENTDLTIANKNIRLELFPDGAISIDSPEKLNYVTAYPEMDFILEADIDMTGIEFSGLCSPESPFKGKFDGNGHVIKGLKFVSQTTNEVGLFRRTNNATIRNLGIENADFNGNEDVGGIVGFLDRSNIEQCFVTNSRIEARDRSGGIAGRIQWNVSYITDCYVQAEIVVREHQAGGIVAASFGDDPVTISNCYFAGSVSNDKDWGHMGAIIGLLDGNHNLTIQNCVSLASSIGSTSNSHRIMSWGGRENWANLTNNYSLATTLVNNVPKTDGTLANREGLNIPEGDANAKTATFYKDVLHWDFENTWKILSDGYPVFKWQKTPIDVIIPNVRDIYVIQEGDMLDLSTLKSLNGLDLSFACDDNSKVQITDANVAVMGLTKIEYATIDILASNDFRIKSLNVALLPAGTIAITTPEELQLVTYKPNADYELANDIDMTGVSFGGLCTESAPFKGIFDGKGHIIKGIKIDKSSDSRLGLFRYISNATIKNLGIEDAEITGYEDVAAIAGHVDRSIIEQCYIKNSTLNGNDRAAAIAGWIEWETVVQNCYAESTDIIARTHQAGGIIGATVSGGGSILNTYFSGTITGKDNRSCGIVGLINNPVPVAIKNCLNLASFINGTHSFRITDWNWSGEDAQSTTLENNYSLASTLVKGALITNGSTTNRNGENLPDDADALAADFYLETLHWDFDAIWGMAVDKKHPVLRVFEEPSDFEIAANGSRTSKEYKTGIYDNIIFIADNNGNVGQLIIEENELIVNGVVKFTKTFEPTMWYPVGFPFEVASIRCEDFETNGDLWGADLAVNKDFWLKTYNGAANAFETSASLAANTGYIIQFPNDFTAHEVIFISDSKPTLYNKTAPETPIFAEYSLVVNPSVAQVGSIDGAEFYYKYNKTENKFLLMKDGDISNIQLKPFEAIVVTKGVAESALRASIGLGAEGLNDKIAEKTNDSVIKVRYYTLQGVEIELPVNDGIYLKQETFTSKKVKSSKIVFNRVK